jgi:hypothetical protein
LSRYEKWCILINNMQNQTQTKLKIDTELLIPYTDQLAAVLVDSKFARIPHNLYSNSVEIFEKKLTLLLSEVENITQINLKTIDSLDEVISRIEFAQKYFYEDAFAKSIESFLDMYLISDLDEELRAYRVLEQYFLNLDYRIKSYLIEINYPQFIGNLNLLIEE